ncbi:VWA domain-containing protein [Novosphingobium colocasiae]
MSRTHRTRCSPPSSDDNGNTVEGTATTSLNTDVMKVFGYRVINLTATCASSMGVGNSDVMMVLDNTGSMGSSLGNTTRIAALRTAMNNFYTTLSTSTAGSNARIRYGFVPFSTTVNVGRLLYNLNPAYLRDSTTYQSREPEYRTEYSYGNSPNSSSSNTVYVNGTATTGLYNSSRYSSSTACSNAASSTPAETTFFELRFGDRHIEHDHKRQQPAGDDNHFRPDADQGHELLLLQPLSLRQLRDAYRDDDDDGHLQPDRDPGVRSLGLQAGRVRYQHVQDFRLNIGPERQQRCLAQLYLERVHP